MKQIYAIAIVAFSALNAQAQTPLNINGSLESWSNAETEAEGWRMSNASLSSGMISKVTEGAQDGNVYVKLAALTQPGFLPYSSVGLKDVEVTGGETYTISYWYKSEEDSFNFKHWAEYRASSSPADNISGSYPNFQPSESIAANTGDWQQVVVTQQAPANATVLRLYFRNFLGSSSAYIDNVVIYQGAPIASIKQNEIEGLKVYPNPATDVVTISSNSASEKNVQIFDIVGKKVLETATFGTVNISSLNNGVYILKVEENGKVASRKLIKK